MITNIKKKKAIKMDRKKGEGHNFLRSGQEVLF